MKLHLRDFFWLVFLAAIVTMWWMDRSKLVDRLSFYETPRPVAATPAPPVMIWPPAPQSFPASPAPPVEPDGDIFVIDRQRGRREVKVFVDQPYSPPGARLLDEPEIEFPAVK